MERQLSLYISAAPEMDAECELVGQTLAGLTKGVRWVIRRTPSSREPVNPDLVALRASQFYLMLLGTDLVAPMGVEWMAAREAGLAVFAFRPVARLASPAAAYLGKSAGVEWRSYRSAQEFARAFEQDLITRLVEGTPGYGLELADIEELGQRLRALREGHETPAADERRGAGRGGVILPLS
jgi:hypothetical protein